MTRTRSTFIAVQGSPARRARGERASCTPLEEIVDVHGRDEVLAAVSNGFPDELGATLGLLEDLDQVLADQREAPPGDVMDLLP